MSKKEKYLTASQRTVKEDTTELENESDYQVPNVENSDGDISEEDAEKETLSGEDALEMHYMGFVQKMRYKLQQYKEKTKDMSPSEHVHFFIYYYKWPVIFIAGLIICTSVLVRQIYVNSRPLAIGLAVINNTFDNELLLAKQIESDYRNYYPFKDSDRFFVLENLEIDPENYFHDISSTSSGTITSYENLFFHISGDNLDVILTDEAGILYCVEQDLVYPLENFLSEETRALYENDICIYTSYTNQEREYAIDISDTAFAASLNLGYDKVYIMLPSNDEDNKQRAEKFIRYIYSKS